MGGGRFWRRHRGALRLGLPGHLPAAAALGPPPGARPVATLAGPRARSRGWACAAPSRSPLRSSVPLTTDAGTPFPQRALIIYLAFSVVIATLVLQGLSLPLVIRLLGLEDDGVAEKEETKARIRAAEAALSGSRSWRARTGSTTTRPSGSAGAYGFRRRRFAARFDRDDDGKSSSARRLPAAAHRAARRRAPGGARAAARRAHQRRGDAAARARPRPRGGATRHSAQPGVPVLPAPAAGRP